MAMSNTSWEVYIYSTSILEQGNITTLAPPEQSQPFRFQIQPSLDLIAMIVRVRGTHNQLLVVIRILERNIVIKSV